MTGWRARIVGGLTSLSFVACAAIAGLRDPIESDALPSAEAREDASEGTSTTSSSSSGGDSDTGMADDAARDAPAEAPDTCPRKPDGLACTTAGECCSDRCNEARFCAKECRGFAEGCDPTKDAPCCVGYYCAGVLCGLCIGPGGNPALALGGGSNQKSCCSREIDVTTKKCK